jgi:DNA repair protein RadA/Sms
MGRCPNCGEWNSMVEFRVEAKERRKGEKKAISEIKPQKLSQIKSITRARIKTEIEEFDRVLGGGALPGAVILVAGEPGIGKSTLMLQVAAKTGGLYISGEESLEQIKLRSGRLGVKNPNLLFLAETDIDVISQSIEEQSARVIVIDSIQTMQTDDLTGVAGSVGQVRECSARLLKIGKSQGIPLFLVGHVTKAGAIAGPKVLEHMVDTVVYFEGERFGTARLLRATKNRFGATDEVGIFEMTDKGLIEVTNPSKLFLKKRVKKTPGSVVVSTIEGTRPVLTEIQALVVPTQLAVPRRIGRGVNYHRLQLITAVLTKRLNLPLAGFDIFVNVAGGLRVEEPAADLGIALAILSSFKNIALDEKIVVFGELGLLGELREVSQAQKRVKEARRLGFMTIISPPKFSSLSQVAKRLLK